MGHKHQAMVDKVFAHPMAMNLDWKKLSSALTHFGAEITVSESNHAKIIVNGSEFNLSLPHHGHELNNRDDIARLKHFLEENGIKGQ
ncbi:hypothetical protein [Hydrogenovibrio kuenenii]|uniref:hypothetical protein n=1 Tax=Hydrogenovibrio kuenenii TaxID=63658 RepID=UPI000465177E|nr:hypothetical protein [Hydrogenovibrio kuenenii]